MTIQYRITARSAGLLRYRVEYRIASVAYWTAGWTTDRTLFLHREARFLTCRGAERFTARKIRADQRREARRTWKEVE